jgi:DNA-binding LacI/PurR family transcriptional regulator
VPHDGTVQALEGLTLDVPVILVGAPGGGLFSGALVDQKLGARLAVSHLIDLGHRRIGHVSGPQDWVDGRSRAEGWGERLREAGLPDDLLIEGDWSAGAGYRIGRQLAAERTVTALFVGNDQMALGLLRAFNEAGVRVPEDVSVVGFDDQPESGYFTPPLTTVRQDFEELGRRCMNVMLGALKGGPGAGTVVVEPELVVRSSTSAPA